MANYHYGTGRRKTSVSLQVEEKHQFPVFSLNRVKAKSKLIIKA